jgi:hypothetical protein
MGCFVHAFLTRGSIQFDLREASRDCNSQAAVDASRLLHAQCTTGLNQPGCCTTVGDLASWGPPLGAECPAAASAALSRSAACAWPSASAYFEAQCPCLSSAIGWRARYMKLAEDCIRQPTAAHQRVLPAAQRTALRIRARFKQHADHLGAAVMRCGVQGRPRVLQCTVARRCGCGCSTRWTSKPR